jgi:hypothetical protein
MQSFTSSFLLLLPLGPTGRKFVFFTSTDRDQWVKELHNILDIKMDKEMEMYRNEKENLAASKATWRKTNADFTKKVSVDFLIDFDMIVT